MCTRKSILVVWAALALSAVPSLAAEKESKEPDIEKTSYTTARRFRPASADRPVTIWRGGKASPAATRLNQDDEGEPAMPPLPNDDAEGQTPWEGRPNDSGGTPFGDEAENGQAGPACSGAGCSTSSCSTSGCDEACECAAWWAHRSSIFGEYLYFHPSGIDIAHAIQQNGTGGAGTTPDGRVGVVDQNYTSAYGVGFAWAMTDCASIQVDYRNFHSHNSDVVTAPDVLGGTVASLVLHPESLNAGSTSQFVRATNDIDFQVFDIDYRRLLGAGCQFAWNYAIGLRYAKLDQGFAQLGDFTPPTGTLRTTTDIQFEGTGLRAGLDGMQKLGGTRWGLYGKGFINVLFGRFDSTFVQANLTTASIQANSNWADERVVPVLEYEVGLNWTSHSGHWRFSAGYYTAFWFNAVTTPQYVQAVQHADFVNVGDTITFDGLVSRLEYRF